MVVEMGPPAEGLGAGFTAVLIRWVAVPSDEMFFQSVVGKGRG